ncbi:MAG: glycosyltransferase [Spirulinaceae cyanobacterium]
MQPNILIYRDDLLSYSETFIPAQVENYRSYQGIYVGSFRHRGKAYPLPPERTLVLSDLAKFTLNRKILYTLTGGWGYPQWFAALKALNPSLLHAHFAIDGVWALPIVRRLKLPLVVTFHGYDIAVNERSKNLDRLYGPKPLPQLYLWQRQQLFQRANCCIAVSNFIRDRAIAKGCPADKIEVCYIGVDVDLFQPDESISRQPIVLFVGRLAPKKGCEYLIRAMAEVQKSHPELELVIIGDGELRQDLERLAEESLPNYRFLGVQPPQEVRRWMNQALMQVVPSVTDSLGNTEGLPMTVIEAQAMKLPVIGSIHAGIPEAIASGNTGFLVAERDWQGIAQTITTLAKKTQLRQTVAIAARKQAEQRFNLKQNITQIEAIYNRILEAKTL